MSYWLLIYPGGHTCASVILIHVQEVSWGEAVCKCPEAVILFSRWPLGPHLTKVFGLIIQTFKKKKNFCYYLRYNWLIMSQFYTCHDSWAVMAYATLWPDLVIIFYLGNSRSFLWYALWACKIFVTLIWCQNTFLKYLWVIYSLSI